MKKKIVILTSDGGGGQKSVAQALEESLCSTYTIITRRAITDILHEIDPVQRMTFGKYIAEDVYNTVSTYKSLWGFHQVLFRFGVWYFRLFFNLIEKRFTNFFIEEKIDAVISIVPIFNKPILMACEKVGIPFLIFSPDIDPGLYLEYLDNSSPSVPFALALPAQHPQIDALLSKKNLPHGCIHEVGFPLRSQFFTSKDPLELKKNYGIPLDKPVILTLLGSLGSPNLSTIAEYLAQIKHPAHLILCTGRYEKVKKALSEMTFPNHISLTIVEYTTKMNDYMRMSDIFFTKSGSVSVGEALSLNIPLMLDATGSILPLEKFNHILIEEKRLGKSIKNYDDIPLTIDELLANNGIKLTEMRNRLVNYRLKDGNLEIQKLLDCMCAEVSAYNLPSVLSAPMLYTFEKKKA